MKTIAEALETGDAGAAVAAVAARTDLVEALREVAHAAAPRLDVDHPPVPAHVHPYQALGAAAGLLPLLPRHALLPLAQAAWYLALSPRIGAHREHEARIVGEEVHLSKSLLSAIRQGEARDAARLFNGLLGRRERALLGDLFFQGAAEDTVSSGHKLSVAVLGWVLARQVGWEHTPALTLWPVVHYVASPPKEASVFLTASRALAKSMVDLEVAGRNAGRSVSELAGLREALGAGKGEEAAQAAAAALKSGTGGDGVLDEVARRCALAALVDGDAPLHALAFTHAARFAFTFSRSGHRLLPVVEAAVIAAGLPTGGPSLPGLAPVRDPAAALNEMALAIEMGDTGEALALLRGYLESGGAPDEAVATLAREASKEDAHATGGHSLVYAHAALQEYRHSHGPDRWLSLAALTSWLARLEHRREVVEALGAFV